MNKESIYDHSWAIYGNLCLKKKALSPCNPRNPRVENPCERNVFGFVFNHVGSDVSCGGHWWTWISVRSVRH